MKPIYRQPHVVPICMPGAGEEEFLGRMGIVTGWGRLEYGETIVNNIGLECFYSKYIQALFLYDCDLYTSDFNLATTKNTFPKLIHSSELIYC